MRQYRMLKLLFKVILCMVPLAQANAQKLENEETGNSRSFDLEAVGPAINGAIYDNGVLLRMASVMKELKLTGSQKSKLKELDMKFNLRVMQLRKRLGEQQKAIANDVLAPNDAGDLRQEFGFAIRELSAQCERESMKILDRGQVNRLNQIRYQTLGPRLFSDSEVQRILNLDPIQIEKIRMILTENRKSRSAALKVPDEFASSSKVYEKFKKLDDYKKAIENVQTKAQEIRVETMQSIAKVLTRGQRRNYEKLIGEPFDMTSFRDKAAGRPTEKGDRPPAATQVR